MVPMAPFYLWRKHMGSMIVDNLLNEPACLSGVVFTKIGGLNSFRPVTSREDEYSRKKFFSLGANGLKNALCSWPR